MSKDPKQAFLWLKRASDAGNARAHVILGSMHEKGMGVPANPAVAATLYEKAAKDGSIDGLMACARLASDRRDRTLATKDVQAFLK